MTHSYRGTVKNVDTMSEGAYTEPELFRSGWRAHFKDLK